MLEKNKHKSQVNREYLINDKERLHDEGEARGLQLAAEYLGPVLAKELDKRLPCIEEHEERISRVEYWMGSTPRIKTPLGQIYLYIGATIAITTMIILFVKGIL